MQTYTQEILRFDFDPRLAYLSGKVFSVKRITPHKWEVIESDATGRICSREGFKARHAAMDYIDAIRIDANRRTQTRREFTAIDNIAAGEKCRIEKDAVMRA